MEETAPSRLLAQEGLPPPAQDGVGQANCTGSIKESQTIDQLKYSQKLSVYRHVKGLSSSVHKQSVTIATRQCGIGSFSDETKTVGMFHWKKLYKHIV